ncbi:MAG: hypothetical protein ACK2TX_03945 [Anaerolineales bacterium]|jgi:hypothetical protein
MPPYGDDYRIMAEIREAQKQEATRARQIKECLPPDGKLELLVRNLGFGMGQVLESAGEWLQKQAADQSSTDAIEFQPKGMNDG